MAHAGHYALKLNPKPDYQHIKVEPITLALGAYVSGVNFSDVCSNMVYAEIADALWKYHVLFFRNQTLPGKSHLALARSFGKPEVHEIFQADNDYPEISILENDNKRPPEINTWHTDTTFRKKPSLCTILFCETMPEAGGDTMWLNQNLAFETLSEPIREMLLGLEAEHDILNYYAGTEMLEGAGGEEKGLELRKTHPVVRHPVIISHPITRKPCLLVNPTHTKKLSGLRSLESHRILQFLYEHQQTPEFTVRFRWEPGSISIWDNFATQHYAFADYYPMHRKMRRITVEGENTEAYDLRRFSNNC
ncbi:MAG: taurine dioxygenase [Magnetovibrio sp.]|nr:taurine dioxygenase [Magnetovibrio sp.]